jgi:hypothetical protein
MAAATTAAAATAPMQAARNDSSGERSSPEKHASIVKQPSVSDLEQPLSNEGEIIYTEPLSPEALKMEREIVRKFDIYLIPALATMYLLKSV